MSGEASYALAGPSSAAWDPAGTRVAVLVQAGMVVVRVGASAVEVAIAAPGGLRSFAWSPDGATLVVAHEGHDLLRCVRAADGAELWRTAIGETAVDELSWSPDGRRLACCGDAVVVCDATTGATLWRRDEHRPRTLAGMQLQGAGDRLRVAEHVRFVDERVCPDELHWSPDATLVAARWGAVFRVLDGDDAAVRAEGPVAAGVLRWGACGEPLVTAGALRLGLCTTRIDDRRARTITFSPDGRYVAAEGDRHCLWVEDEHGVRALAGHPRTITAMAWSSTGELATACRDGVIRRWSRGDAAIVPWCALAGVHGGLAWSPAGSHLAVCCPDALVILRR